MGKTAGDNRSSKWENSIYDENGVRKEYSELSTGRKNAVKAELKSIQRQMYANLQNKNVTLKTDKENITVGFTKKMSGTRCTRCNAHIEW